MSWKTTIYDYVHHKNQMEMDYSVEPLLSIVTDSAYLQDQVKRLARTAHSDQDRNFFTMKNETRLTIIGASEQPSRVKADLLLRRTSVGIIGSTEQEEQRLEKERVTLEEVDGKWYIASIEPKGIEQAVPLKRGTPPGGLLEMDEHYADYGLMRAPSMPYLNHNVLPYLEANGRKQHYDRLKAAAYAELWWDKANPAYIEFEVDCSNFISQCLFAGGGPMNYTGKRTSGWWYKGRFNGQEHWSFSWSVAQALQWYLLMSRTGLRAEEASSADQLELGDVISYDWDGDGRFQHSTIVTAKDGNGMPLVNAHTTASHHRYWSYKDSVAWTERTRYRFLRITDFM
ncbi:amidase domain-containing protein [Paenibacillus rigui]|uniref:Putative amidase domain-containing protein n=1 Tax=Paenibacillus rigui TaxID=554312 RepID=A0A229UPZ6_9BACL|nr:amidase domain-containing protein [Paenibacillus rigui]OXM84959.1 hypothetical protein CF651_18840 [Paenibacillus rigui]